MKTYDPTRLKQLRLAKNYKQREVAGKLNLDPSAISNYEKGKRTPDIQTLERLAKLYGVNVSYILGEKQGTLKSKAVVVQEKKPYFAPKTPQSILFLLMLLVSVNVMAFLASPYTIMLFLMAGSLALMAHTYYAFIHKNKTYLQFDIPQEKKLYFVHEEEKSVLRKTWLKENVLIALSSLLVFLTLGFFSVVAREEAPEDFAAITTSMGVFFLFIAGFIVFNTLRPAQVKKAASEHFNLRMNTLRYNVLKVFVLMFYVWQLMLFGTYYYGFDSGFIVAAVYLFIQGSLFMPYIAAHEGLKRSLTYTPTVL